VPAPKSVSRVSKTGTIKFGSISCPATALGACDGPVRLLLGFKLGLKPAAAKAVVLGSAKFGLKPAKSIKPKLKLNRGARARLAKKHKLVVSAVVVTRDSAGNTSTRESKLTLASIARNGGSHASAR
jgi:hypothetical protein